MLCKNVRTVWTGALRVECQKRGPGTGFVKRSLEIAQVDEMGSEGSGSSQEETERSESDVRELRFGETFQERARILDVVRDK